MFKLRTRAVLAGLTVAAVAFVAGALVVAGSSADAATTVTARYSPLGATANGPSGPGSAMFTASPYCCPSTAVILTPQSPISGGNAQWLQLGLPWDNGTVTAVRVCYAISTGTPGGTFIDQTRITSMTTPNSAVVMVDDTAPRNSTAPACYTVHTSFAPTGTLTLGLGVVFASTSDRITIGMVSLSGHAI